MHGVICGFTLAIRGHDEECGAIWRQLVQVLEIVFLGVTNEGSKAKFRLGLLGETNSVLLCSACLRAVKDDETLVLDER